MKHTQKSPILTLFFLFIMTIFGSSHMLTSKSNRVAYGEAVYFEKDKSIQFADFTLTYLGERQEDITGYSPGSFLYFDFEIRSKSASEIVSWTSGTGDIAPTFFEFEDKSYFLEMTYSDFIDLKNGQMVIWKKTTFEALADQGHNQ